MHSSLAIHMWAVSFITLLLYPQRKSTGHTFTGGQGGHKSQSREIFCPFQELNQDSSVQSTVQTLYCLYNLSQSLCVLTNVMLSQQKQSTIKHSTKCGNRMPSKVPSMLHICDLLYNSGSEKVQQMDCTSLILVTSLYNEAYSLITFSLFSCKISSHFNVHGSMHRKNILIYMQQDATLHSLFISRNCFT